MRYTPEQEERYTSGFAYLENVLTSISTSTHQSTLNYLDADSHIQFFTTPSFNSDAFIYEVFPDGSYEPEFLNPNKPCAFITLNNVEGYRFSEFCRSLDAYNPSDPLPEEFYFALDNGLIIENQMIDQNWKTIPYEGFSGKIPKTYSDLPEDFIDGIRNPSSKKTLTFECTRDVELMKKGHINNIALLSKTMKKRPLTFLIHGFHRGHSSSYIARISEDNHCEIVSLNSGQGYDDDYFIDVLKKGIQKGLDLNDSNFSKPVKKVIIEQKDFSCAAISSSILSQVDPSKSLEEQIDHLSDVMRGVIHHSQMTRRLMARMQWWHLIIHSPNIFTQENGEGDQDHYKQMQKIFNQLLYFVIDLDPPQKIDFPEDERFREDFIKFLNVFDIKLNDENFLSLFNEFTAMDTEEISELYQEEPQWYEAPDQFANDLIKEDEVDSTSKATLIQAVQDLATHAKNHLISTSESERAKAGQAKLDRLNILFSAENLSDLETFKTELEKILDAKNPQKSPVLKNRGGFFGAYKTFSFFAHKAGSPHYSFKNRTAISSTDHYLIALYDAVTVAIQDANLSRESNSNS